MSTDNHSLKVLNLELNQLGDEGAIAISGVLADQHHSYDGLHALNLGSNEITCDGALHIARALEQNMSLKVLNLSSNLILDAQPIADGVLANVEARGGVLEAMDVSSSRSIYTRVLVEIFLKW